ncbi:hypothetical protein E5Q_05849 [Mixia osmundae IAM 14324]|uniref:Solute carrier family 40 member n=1 Tax=Mixia osmundae (strain CBS 9802 / IAM 14324 / JCM 22182 / KY 12970) TaxID=764103 RepID=G7E8J7_MIXOS|nr:hypothetical protein E5Q_05849 [Mixia osmundae IAM 14324]
MSPLTELAHLDQRQTTQRSEPAADIELTSIAPVHAQNEHNQDEPLVGAETSLDGRAFWSLLLQHASGTWGDRTAEFAWYLYLIELFKSTLLPASLYGFFTTGIAILLSGSIGSMVDRHNRLTVVRWAIVCQKSSATVAYAAFLLLFAIPSLRDEAANGRHARGLVWLLFTLITLSGCVLRLSTIAISVAIERDWATCIAQGSSARLTKLNTSLRRIDLGSKLLAPLFVSLLTTTASYLFSVAFLAGLGLITFAFEFVWIQVVYERMPMLAQPDPSQRVPVKSSSASEAKVLARISHGLLEQKQNWLDFIRHPIFASSLSISLLYLTVLSFDGSMIAYLKTHNFSDPFVAGMRGLCVVTGLLGTFLGPLLESKLGLIRAGSWSIWGEVVSLLPALLSFFVLAPQLADRGLPVNSMLLFGGMAASRIFLWSFDLIQLKQLQTMLADHPRRNAITALQFSTQNMLDLCKYVLTIIVSQPQDFKWAALVSYLAVCAGAFCYLVFLRRLRGHIVHLDWLESLIIRKSS